MSLKGKRFKIRGVRLFNVKEITGELYGQAVIFNQYEEEVRRLKCSCLCGYRL